MSPPASLQYITLILTLLFSWFPLLWRSSAFLCFASSLFNYFGPTMTILSLSVPPFTPSPSVSCAPRSPLPSTSSLRTYVASCLKCETTKAEVIYAFYINGKSPLTIDGSASGPSRLHLRLRYRCLTSLMPDRCLPSYPLVVLKPVVSSWLDYDRNQMRRLRWVP